MSNHQIREKWNEIFVQFLDELIRLFPDSPASSIKMKFYLSNMVGGKEPIELYLEHLLEHENEVLEKNEDYFFNSGKKIEFVENLNLKKYYMMSNDDVKNTIWQYMNALLLLSKEHMKLKVKR